MTVGILREEDAVQTMVAERLRAELDTRKHLVGPLECSPTAVRPHGDGPQAGWAGCRIAGRQPDALIALESTTAGRREVVGWVVGHDRSAGPFRVDAEALTDARAMGRFTAELMAWIDVLLPAKEKPSPSTPITPSTPIAPTAEVRGPTVLVASPELRMSDNHQAPLLNVGLGAGMQQSLEGLGTGYGPEVSIGVDWPTETLVDRWGLGASAFGSWGARLETDVCAGCTSQKVQLRSTPITGVLRASGTWLRGRWRVDVQLGAGAEWLSLEAFDISPWLDLPHAPIPIGKGTRFGFVGQGGIAAFRGLDVVRDHGDQVWVGIELNAYSAIPPQLVTIGERNFGNSRLPSVVASLSLRWDLRPSFLGR